MIYFPELRLNWTALLAAALGLSLGSSINFYTLSMFGPALLAEFGWSKQDFALVGSIPLFTMFLVPLAGRFTDRFGPRIAAMVGFTAVPLGFLSYTMMSGNLLEFFAIYMVQQVLGILTTGMVFARLIVERFDRARGIALSLLMTGPPLMGAIVPLILGEVMQHGGWRMGYVLLALLSATGGGIAILWMGRSKPAARPAPVGASLSLRDLLGLLSTPVLLFILGGMLLVNVPQVVSQSQLKLIAMDSGVSDNSATWLVSLYAMGVIAGRFACGLALDRGAAHRVAAVTLGLPAVGLLIWAFGSDLRLLAAGILLLGLAQGAEGDISAYLISRRFDMRNYSLLLSMVTATIMAGSAIGSLVLYTTLEFTDRYSAFLVICAGCTLMGALLFLGTGGQKGKAELVHEDSPAEPGGPAPSGAGVAAPSST